MTTDGEIEKTAREWLEDFGQMTDLEDDYINAFKAGFKAGVESVHKELELISKSKDLNDMKEKARMYDLINK